MAIYNVNQCAETLRFME